MNQEQFLQQFENIELDIRGVRLPKVAIPDKYLNKFEIDQGIPHIDFLRLLCKEGFELRKWDESRKEEYDTRVDYELKVIDELGFTDYLLLVWDVTNFCHDNDIPIGEGRGSAAGSLVLYLIGSTGIDPIEYSLIFERFISKVRAKSTWIDGIQYIDGSLAPDVDLDVCTDRRPEVLSYLEEKYAGKFCKLPTISRLTSKQVIKDVGKIFKEIPDDDMTVVTKTIPVLYGQPTKLAKAAEESEGFAAFEKEHPDVVKIAKKLEGLMRQKGSHASAYLVSFRMLDEFIPCEMDTHGELTCSYDMHYAQEECIKLDVLGLHGVTLVDNIKKLCLKRGIDLGEFDADDPDIYESLQTYVPPYGLFQIGADANFEVLQKVKPNNLEELAAVVALARPGALAYVDEYVDNAEKSHFGIPELAEVLNPTHSVPLYQEQTMAIAHKVFGMTLDDAELLRRVIGKKKVEEMPAWEERVYKASEEKGYGKEVADFYWKLLDESANYSFNKSHAVSYAYLAALTVYLKTKYPREFYAECLNMLSNKNKAQDSIAQIQRELQEYGIKLLPPDLMLSNSGFTISDNNIRFGFSSIKGVSEKSLSPLSDFLTSEKANKFEVFNAASEAGLNIGILCALIQAGMLQSTKRSREMLVYEAQIWGLLTPREQVFCLENGETYDYDLLHMVKNIESWVREDGKPVARATRPATLKKNSQRYKKIYLQNTQWPTFASWWYETTLLGYSYSSSLRNVFAHKCPELQNIKDISECSKNSKIQGVGRVEKVIRGISKKGNKYIKMVLADETAAYDAMLVGDKMEHYSQNNPTPPEGSIVFFAGQKGDEIVWIDRLRIQDNKVYLKLGDIRKYETNKS